MRCLHKFAMVVVSFGTQKKPRNKKIHSMHLGGEVQHCKPSMLAPGQFKYFTVTAAKKDENEKKKNSNVKVEGCR
jgi:hypothetical protein